MFTVEPHCQIINWLGLKNSSSKTVSICAFSFVISLHLIPHIYFKHPMRQRLKFRRRTKHPLNVEAAHLKAHVASPPRPSFMITIHYRHHVSFSTQHLSDSDSPEGNINSSLVVKNLSE
jgi:hypothetical protein